MLRRIKAILLVVAILCMAVSVPAFAEEIEFNAEVKVNYDDSKISFTVESPAKYRQVISIRMYVGDPEVLVRTMEVTADARGNASGVFTMDTSVYNEDISGYYTLKFQGGGYMAASSKDEVTVFYERNSELYDETLPRFNAATEDTIGDLLLEKQDMLTFDFGEYYKENSELLHKIFINTRLVDFGNEYSKFTQVQDTMDTITLISAIKQAASPDAVRRISERNMELLEVNPEHKYYKGNEDAIYTVLINLVEESTPLSLKELKKHIRQAIALAELNRSNAEKVTEVISNCYSDLGIDIDDYNSLCSIYGAKNFNKPFVEANYKTVTAFNNAYINRKNTISESTGGSGGAGGGGGGGGSLGGGSPASGEVIAPVTNIEISAASQPEKSQIGFADVVTSHWAYQSVVALAELDIVSGFEDGSFRPDENVTREQFIKMLVEAFGFYDETAECNFSDVSKDAWYYKYVASAFAGNITKGQGTIFGSGNSITREDAAVLIHRVMVTDADEYEAKKTFADDSEFADYSKSAVYKLVDMSILSGMGNNSFAPKANLTRAQAAKIIYAGLSYSYKN